MPDKDFLISPDQAARLLALSEMLRHGDICFRGDEEEDEQTAYNLLIDVGQELALQVGVGNG